MIQKPGSAFGLFTLHVYPGEEPDPIIISQ